MAPKLAGKMDLMPGQENFLWFIANEEKIRTRKDSDGNMTLVSTEIAMPSVFNGNMRERIFAKQKFTDEFEAVGGLFYGQCAEYCGNSHAYMSFRALAQTDEDFDLGLNAFKTPKIPTYNPESYDPEEDLIPERFYSPFADNKLR